MSVGARRVGRRGANNAPDADDIVEAVRRYAAEKMAPVATDFEARGEYPLQIIRDLADMGMLGTSIGRDNGGVDLTVGTIARVLEELSAAWMSVSGIVATHLVTSRLIRSVGTAGQRSNWLPLLATGEVLGALSISEPDAGSDVQAMRCIAEPDGDAYVINGSKMWVTSGGRAGVVALFCRAPEGITGFLIDTAAPGAFGRSLQISPEIDKLGQRATDTVEMTYVDHRVPRAAVLGGEAGLGRGLRCVLAELDIGRVNIAACACGVAGAAFEAASAYAAQRTTFGRPIDQHQAIQFKLAEMATKLDAARLMTEDAARRCDGNEPAEMHAAMAKLFASEVGLDALRIHGCAGYTTATPVERFFRDAPLMIIGEGTNEIQKVVIARHLAAQRSRVLTNGGTAEGRRGQ